MSADMSEHAQAPSTTAQTEVAADHAHSAHAGPVYHDATFWVAMAFVVLAAALGRPLIAALNKMLDERRVDIQNRMDEAAKLKQEAQEALAYYKRKQREALTEAEEILADAKAQAELMQKKTEDMLMQQLKRREEQVLERIQAAEQNAVEEIKAMAVDIAVAATREIINERLSDEDLGKLINESIDQLPEKLH